MKTVIRILYLFLALILTSCQAGDGTIDIRNYYFPLKVLEDGLVYEYQPQGNTPSGPAFWYYRSIRQDGTVHLTGTYYEQDLIPLQLSNELMTEAGMVLEDLYLYETDSLTGNQLQVPVQVVQDDVFPFQVRPNGGVFLYHVTWQAPQDTSATLSLIKNRRYLRDTSFVFEGQTYPAQLFELKELISHEQEGVWEQEYPGREIYAKGLGLVYYEKRVNEALQLQFRLERRYPMEELEARFRQQYEESSTEDNSL